MTRLNVINVDPTRLQGWAVDNCKVFVDRYTYDIGDADIITYGAGTTLHIGRYCSLAMAITFILGGNHRHDWATTFSFGHKYQEHLGGEGIVGHPVSKGDIVIGNDVWIAHGAKIMSGVTIGDGAVIATNSLIIKDVAPYEIVGGNPQRHISYRFTPEIIELLLELRWWGLPTEHVKVIAYELSQPPTVENLKALVEQYKHIPRD